MKSPRRKFIGGILLLALLTCLFTGVLLFANAVEKLLAEELPRIGEAIPEIISGPNYKGIVSMGKGTVTIAIFAEYRESAFFKVQRSLNHSIQKLFEQNHIRIM